MGKSLFFPLAGLIGLASLTSVTAANPTSADQARVAAGRVIYQQHCAVCHGGRGEGQPGWQERDAQGELPAPSHGPEGHTWKHSDAMLYQIVKDGWRDPFNKTQRLTMPAFAQTLSPSEMQAVITYLKTLWTPKQRLFQREESLKQPFPPAAR